jgi:hypothetical protein
MENKITWTLVQNDVSNCVVKTEANGQITIIPIVEENSDYQEYLEHLEADK